MEARFLRHLAKIIGPRATLASVVGPKLAMVFTVVRLCHDTGKSALLFWFRWFFVVLLFWYKRSNIISQSNE